MGFNRTPMSKVMAVWIGLELPCSISSVSVYYVPDSDIRVKSYDRFNFSRTSIYQCRASRYIMGLNRTSMLKVMAGWIGLELSCSILSVSIYYVRESEIRVKCYDQFNFSSTTIFQFRASRYILGFNRTPMSKVMAVLIGLEFPCSISSVSIYHGPQSYIHVKSYGRLNWTRVFVFNFERLDILCAWFGHPRENLWPFEFL